MTREIPLRRATAICICCSGTGAALVSVYPWGMLRSICVRCNLGDCGRLVTDAAVGSAEWGCHEREQMRILRGRRGRRW